MSTTRRNDWLPTWEKLQSVTEHLRRETGRSLTQQANLSQPEFTVLAHLAPAADGMRPSACARAIGWDTSRLSHQLRRLERRGYVLRSSGGAADGRATVVRLSDEGRRTYRRALGPHLRAAEHWFGAALSEEQLVALSDVLEALALHIDRESAATENPEESS